MVEGDRLTRKEARVRAFTFVGKLGVISSDESVARWTVDVCPKVVG